MTGGPLSGVTVLDLCSYLAGPYGCTLLADLGASVIKIESPQGDMLRQFPSSLADDSRFFLGTNRGKRALALDLKQPEGLAVLHRLVKTADVRREFSSVRAGQARHRLPATESHQSAPRLLWTDRLR
jgi:crotonobetainyl-CoA:carnitine CoA-transferase CaiB-like acyl-CoA transferase